MSRTKGKTKALTPDQVKHVFAQLKTRRYPEKNKAILMLSFSLGLTAQEIARLRIKDIADTTSNVISVRDHITIYPRQQSSRHATAMRENHKGYHISRAQFDALISRVAADALQGLTINAADYYPQKQRYQRALRILPLDDKELRDTLFDYLVIRLDQDECLSSDQLSAPFVLTQKKVGYSPNTLQEHMKLMLADWAGISGATSLSGRITRSNNLLKAGVPLREIQQFFGHISASTTALHTAPNCDRNYLVYDLRSLSITNLNEETFT
jgi:integrase